MAAALNCIPFRFLILNQGYQHFGVITNHTRISVTYIITQNWLGSLGSHLPWHCCHKNTICGVFVLTTTKRWNPICNALVRYSNDQADRGGDWEAACKCSWSTECRFDNSSYEKQNHTFVLPKSLEWIVAHLSNWLRWMTASVLISLYTALPLVSGSWSEKQINQPNGTTNHDTEVGELSNESTYHLETGAAFDGRPILGLQAARYLGLWRVWMGDVHLSGSKSLSNASTKRVKRACNSDK